MPRTTNATPTATQVAALVGTMVDYYMEQVWQAEEDGELPAEAARLATNLANGTVAAEATADTALQAEWCTVAGVPQALAWEWPALVAQVVAQVQQALAELQY